MQIDREDLVGVHGRKHLCSDLRGDRHTRGTHAAILAGVTEVRHHRGDGSGARALERVDDHQQFHQVFRTRGAGGLDHEHVLLTHVFLDLDLHFAVGELGNQRLARPHTQFLADALRKVAVGIAGKDQQVRGILHDSSLGRGRVAEGSGLQQ
ncbi:hypothetical protein D3C71_1648480 [compost metagenome]